MKNLSIVLNVVLLAAVGYLYYYDFSGKKAEDVAAKISTTYIDSNGHRPPLAYIELDSLTDNISYLKEKRKELDVEMKKIDAEHEKDNRDLQAQKEAFLKKGASVTDDEIQKFQGYLYEQQRLIDDKRQSSSQKLNEKNFGIMEDLQKKLKEFLAEYNKDKKFMYIFASGTGLEYMLYKDSALNITNDVIKGMNEKMKPSPKQ